MIDVTDSKNAMCPISIMELWSGSRSLIRLVVKIGDESIAMDPAVFDRLLRVMRHDAERRAGERAASDAAWLATNPPEAPVEVST